MTLSRDTDLGKITISNGIFAHLILESFHQDSCEGKVWPATKKGRVIAMDNKGSFNEFANAIEIESADDGKNIEMELAIIVKFGTSIKKITDYIGDYIASNFHRQYGKRPIQIKIRIAGVKSRQIAKRNLEVIKRYDTE